MRTLFAALLATLATAQAAAQDIDALYVAIANRPEPPRERANWLALHVASCDRPLDVLEAILRHRAWLPESSGYGLFGVRETAAHALHSIDPERAATLLFDHEPLVIEAIAGAIVGYEPPSWQPYDRWRRPEARFRATTLSKKPSRRQCVETLLCDDAHARREALAVLCMMPGLRPTGLPRDLVVRARRQLDRLPVMVALGADWRVAFEDPDPRVRRFAMLRWGRRIPRWTWSWGGAGALLMHRYLRHADPIVAARAAALTPSRSRRHLALWESFAAHANPHLRAFALGRLVRKQPIRWLPRGRTDTHPHVRFAAITACDRRRPLIDVVIAGPAFDRFAAMLALADNRFLTNEDRFRLLPFVATGLYDASPIVRRAALLVAPRLGRSGASLLPRIARMLIADRTTNRALAAAALSAIGGPASVPALVHGLADPDVGVVDRTVRALAAIGPPAASAVDGLVRLGNVRLGPIHVRVRRPRSIGCRCGPVRSPPEHAPRALIEYVIARIGRAAIPALRDALHSPMPPRTWPIDEPAPRPVVRFPDPPPVAHPTPQPVPTFGSLSHEQRVRRLLVVANAPACD